MSAGVKGRRSGWFMAVALVATFVSLVLPSVALGLSAGTSVYGRVTDSVTGEPVAGVQVVAYDVDYAEFFADTTTDDNGDYELALDDGDYALLVNGNGRYNSVWNTYVTASVASPALCDIAMTPKPLVVHGTVRDTSGDPLPGGSVQIQNTAPDVTFEDWAFCDDNGEYAVYGSWDSGTYRATASVSGYLPQDKEFTYGGTSEQVDFDLDGAPVAFSGTVSDAVTGGSLYASVNGYTESGPSYSWWDYTSSDGYYQLLLPAGTYTIEAYASGHASKVLSGRVFDGSNPQTVNISLAPYPLAFKGRVTDAATGEGISGVEVSWSSDMDQSEVQTDESGNYQIFLPAGTYRLEVNERRWLPQVADLTFNGMAAVTRNFALVDSPKAVHGRVVDSVTDDGLAAYVRLSGEMADGTRITDWTDSNDAGEYELFAPAGDYVVTASPESGHFEGETLGTFDGSNALSRDIACDPYPLAFTGRVTDADSGEPIEGARVWANSPDGGDYYWDEVTTGADGSYAIHVPAGDYEFSVNADGHATSIGTGNFDGSSPGTLDFQLHAVTTAFTGTVTDAVSGDPIDEAEVVLTFSTADTQFEDWTSSDVDGRYELYGPKGTSDLACLFARHEAVATTDSFDGVSPTIHDFQLIPYAKAFSGTITDRGSGLPLQGVSVRGSVDIGTDSYSDRVETDENGHYDLYGPEGSWRVEADFSHYAPYSDVTEFTGTTQQLDITLDKYPRAFYGTVTDASSGLPLADASVDAWRDDEFAYYEDWASTDAGGAYELYLPAGSYSCSVGCDDHRSVYQNITFDGGSASRKDFALVRYPRAVFGRVVDIAGEPVRDAEVAATIDSGNLYFEDWGRTDTHGGYELCMPSNAGSELRIFKHGYVEHDEMLGAFNGVDTIEKNVELEQYPKAFYGTVTSSDYGLPVPGIEVSAIYDSTKEYYEDWGVTDADGDYELHAPANTYTIYTNTPTFKNVALPGKDFNGVDPVRVDIDLALPAADTEDPATQIAGVPAAWSRSDVTFSLYGQDSGSAVYRTYYSIGAGAPQVYSGPVTISAQGATQVAYWSVDIAGNTETQRTVTVRIDKTVPVTSTNAAATYVGAASIALSPVDQGGSGLKATYWSVDGAAWTSGTTASAYGVGVHTLQYYSTDNAGNAETVKSVSFSILGVPTFLTVKPSTTAPSKYAASVKFTGALRRDSVTGAGVAGVPVVVNKYAGGKWTTAAWLTTAADGSFSWSNAPLSTTTYQFIYGGDATYASAPAVAVKVVPKASLAKVTAKRSSSRTYKLSGSVKAGAATKTTVRIYRWKKVGKKWKAYKYIKVTAKKSGSTLKYSLKHKFPSKAYWRLQAVSPADSSHASSKSSYSYLKVK